MKLAVKIVRCADRRYRASCAALPGCVVHAGTREQAQSRIRDAVVGYLASMDVALPRESGANLVAEDLGALGMPASRRAGVSAGATRSAAAAGCDPNRRRDDCYAKT